MSRTVSFGKLPLAPAALVFALILMLGACGGGDEVPSSESSPETSSPSSTPSSTDSSAPSKGGTAVVPKGCKDIVASGSVEDIAKMFANYRNDPNSLDAPAMRKALEELSTAADNAPPKIREDAILLVADMGALVDAHEGMEGVGKVATVGEIQKRLDNLCVPNGLHGPPFTLRG